MLVLGYPGAEGGKEGLCQATSGALPNGWRRTDGVSPKPANTLSINLTHFTSLPGVGHDRMK